MQSQSNILFILLALFALSACGGGGDTGDTTAPSVANINPADGSTLQGGSPIVIQFNEAMSPASLSLSGPLATESDGGVWSSTTETNDTLTLHPTMTWRHNQARSLGVDSGGNQGNDDSYELAISADGRYVAFGSSASNLVSGDTIGMDDIFVTPTPY